MRRREFIAGLGTSAAWPLAAWAQQRPAVGWLSSRDAVTDALVLPAFHRGLIAQGFIEGRNVTLEYRCAEAQADRLPALAAELVRRPVEVIIAVGDSGLAARAIQSIDATMPVVGLFSNPVGTDIVPSLARSRGNITGVNNYSNELGSKRLGLLRQLLPGVRTIAVLAPESDKIQGFEAHDVEEAGLPLGLKINVLNASTDRELDIALAALEKTRPDALYVATNPLAFTRRSKIVMRAAQFAIPTMYFRREFVDAGGLMSYGSSADDNFRISGEYAGRILKGEKPVNRPIQQATKFEFVLNLRTANKLGIDVPSTLIALADKVIE
jgi:putative tryptophan/tyrosine transport system substrate-binding protein